MKYTLLENQGFPKKLLYTLAVIAGISVANLYYNQPLLDVIREELNCSEIDTNHIALFTQIGYALGLFFIIPLGDLYSRKRITLTCFTLLVFSLLCIAYAKNIFYIHAASVVTGACSVIPQIFVPLAAQYSEPKNKGRNVGFIISGLLTGILASRVVSGYVGDWLGWRAMYIIAAGMMLIAAAVILYVLPDTQSNFKGKYAQLMRSLVQLVKDYPSLRIYAVRSALAFGSFMGLWATLAFKMAQAPFYAGSDEVGALGLCGVTGALSASFVGQLIQQVGVRRFNFIGSSLQIIAWTLFYFGADHYVWLIAGILIIDIGMQCIQLSNQATVFALCPSAANRINTIFMTTYFLGGSFGTFLAGAAWSVWGWSGVTCSGILLALLAMAVTRWSKC